VYVVTVHFSVPGISQRSTSGWRRYLFVIAQSGIVSAMEFSRQFGVNHRAELFMSGSASA